LYPFFATVFVIDASRVLLRGAAAGEGSDCECGIGSGLAEAAGVSTSADP